MPHCYLLREISLPIISFVSDPNVFLLHGLLPYFDEANCPIVFQNRIHTFWLLACPEVFIVPFNWQLGRVWNELHSILPPNFWRIATLLSGLQPAVGKSDDILTPVPSLLPHVSILKKLIKSYPYPWYSKMSQCVLKMRPVYLFCCALGGTFQSSNSNFPSSLGKILRQLLVPSRLTLFSFFCIPY